MLAIGSSHLGNVAKAAAADGVPLTAVLLRDYERSAALDTNGIGGDLKRDLDAALAADPSPILFALVGSQRSAQLATFRHPQPFDFILPGREELPLDPAAELIPYGAFAALLASRVLKASRMLRAIAGHSGRRVVQFLDPPPPASFKWKTDARRDAREARLTPSPPTFRLKVWLAANRAFIQACDQLRIEWVPPPAEAMDRLGFLDERYRYDGVHGNLDYGRLILGQMQDLSE